MEAGGGKEATAGHRPLGSSNYLHSAGGFGTHLAAIYQQQQLQQQQQHHNHLQQQQQHQQQQQQQHQHLHQQQQQQQQQHHHFYHQHHPLLPHRATSGPPSTVQGTLGSADGASNYPPSPHFASPSTIIHAPAATRPSPGHTLALPANPNHTSNSSSSSYLPDGGVVPPTPPLAIVQHHVTIPSQQIGTTMGASRSEPPKKKRGRPRKYVTDANGAALALLPYSPSVSSPAAKKGRTYGKKAQMEALGAAGQGFTPHIITIAAGEDVSIKIMSFLQHGTWGMCILSATGAISNVILCQPATSGGTVTYEGRFEILSLSGSFLPAENGGPHSRTGGLSVSLAGPDGRVIGGGVAGLFIAASPVKVVVGTFLSESQKLQGRGGSTHVSDSNEIANESPVYVPMQQSSVQDHNSGNAVEDSPQYNRPTHIMPHHPIDWGGNQFDTDSRGDTDTTVPSPDYG